MWQADEYSPLPFLFSLSPSLLLFSAVQELSTKLETTLEQNRVLKRDIANSSDASRRAASLQEKMGQIRRQLRGNQEELKMLKEVADEL